MNKSLLLKIGVGVLVVVLLVIIAVLVKGRSHGDPSVANDRAINEANSKQSNQSNNQSQTTQASSSSTFAGQYPTCDKNAKPVFSHSPLAIDKMGSIVPLGQMSDGHVTPTDHVYVAPVDSNVADNTYDVVMPADGKIVGIGRMPSQYIGDKTGQTLAQDDYNIHVSFSCRYFAIFIHLHKLSPTLQTAIGELPAGQSKQLDVPLKAGELIAHIGGTSFDWTMLDTDTKLAGFISPKLYEGESWKIHTISPFDVYSGELKSQLEAKSLRTVAPLGGKIDYDKAGALVGNWFKEGTNGYSGASQDRYYDGHLSISPHHFTPDTIVYSTGNWQGKAKQVAVVGTFKPESITAESGVTKFEVAEMQMGMSDGSAFSGGNYKKGIKVTNTGTFVGTVMVEVMAGEKLKVEQFPGKKASEVSAFTSAAINYVR